MISMIVQMAAASTVTEVHEGWMACHPPPDCFSSSRHSQRRRFLNCRCTGSSGAWNVSSLPTTALVVLLDQQQEKRHEQQPHLDPLPPLFPPDIDFGSKELYWRDHLSRIPDIHTVGRAFYTILYERYFPTTITLDGEDDRYDEQNYTRSSRVMLDATATRYQRQTLRFAGIHYQATAWLDGRPLPELNAPSSWNSCSNIGCIYNHSNAESKPRTTTFTSTTTTTAPTIPRGNHDAPPGLFRRRYYDISLGGRFNILIEPPFHPGSSQCTASPMTKHSIQSPSHDQPPPERDVSERGGRRRREEIQYSGCSNGQGGNHELAKDGATAQFLLGWDWCQPMPDRSTGFLGSVHLEINTGRAAIIDPTIQTRNLYNCSRREETVHHHHHPSVNFQQHSCDSIELYLLARLECIGEDFICSAHSTAVMKVQSDWGEEWDFPINLTYGIMDIQRALTVQQPHSVHLWWPHGLGSVEVAYLHKFNFRLEINGAVSDEKTYNVGIRTVRTYLDQNLDGQVFQINGKKLYLVGGNWILPDQAFRYSASVYRYCSEIALHRYAGLNLLRVWGGATTERDQFYDCADRLGMLIYQEFWMTGDNNGRWGGEYSSPVDHEAYLVNVRDTIQRLRRHPSLLFYGGCNECAAPIDSPHAPNPPGDIDRGIRAALEEFDPGRFYISSSMSGKNIADRFAIDPTVWFNRSFSLAFADGPYSMQLPQTYFERNPGLPFQNISIGFQPEIGAANVPTYEGMLRFMTEQDLTSGIPARNSNSTNGPIWEYHNFQHWLTTNASDGTVYDHVYSYFALDYDIIDAKDWCAGAALAAHVQYQSLFEGYLSHIMEYTSAVIMWKTQSPWPSLRGFLYDWYLETTGALRGVRAALEKTVSIVFDRKAWRLRLINRRIGELRVNQDNNITWSRIGARVNWIDTRGRVVKSGDIYLARNVTLIPSMSAWEFSDNGASETLTWPSNCTTVCFLKVQRIQGRSVSEHCKWYWLTDPVLGPRSDYAELGTLRHQSLKASTISMLQITSCSRARKRLTVNLTIQVPRESPVLLFYPTLSMQQKSLGDDDGVSHPLLPLFDSKATDVVLVPGQHQHRQLVYWGESNTEVDIVLSSWNGVRIVERILCDDFLVH